MAGHPRTELALGALEAAVDRHGPDDVAHRGGRGPRRTSPALGARREEAGARPSMGSAGGARDAQDDAARGGFDAMGGGFRSLGAELVRRRSRPRAGARPAAAGHVEAFHVRHAGRPPTRPARERPRRNRPHHPARP